MIKETKSRPALQSERYNIDTSAAFGEPTLDEILADPIVHLVLGRDHLEIRDVERFLRSASARLIERNHSPNFGRVKMPSSGDAAGL